MFGKILKKDKNEELEKVLEKKQIDEQAKNLLQGILYKIEVAYKDYQKVKTTEETEEQYVEQLILNIKKNCNKITIVKLNQKLADEELQKELKKNKYYVGEDEIISYPIEEKLLYAIEKKSTNDKILNNKYGYAIAEAVSNFINDGKNIDRIEVLRDFNGWSWTTIKKEIENGKAPVSLNLLSDILNYRLRMLSANDLTKYHGISEGLENRILSSLNENYNIYDIISAVKSKRYAFSRIQRSMLHICLDIKNEDLMRYKDNGYSPYIRVLGFRKDKKDLLGRLTKNSKIPVIVNIKNAEKELNSYGREILEKEIFADNIYSMLYPNKKFSFPNQDYTTPVVIL